MGFKRNKKHYTEEWAIDIQNATNRQNVFTEQFNVKTRQIQTFYQAGLFPAAFYRITFSQEVKKSKNPDFVRNRGFFE